jgi:excisionase family DNA binding protein
MVDRLGRARPDLRRLAARHGAGDVVAVAELPQLLSVSETAEYLDVSLQTVLRMLRDGELRGVKPRNRWYARAADLAELVGGAT